MHDKFFNLLPERQTAIIYAGCKVFAQHGYRKASMSQVALEAGISKALLFHYFRNKKEYYLYLYSHAVNLMLDSVRSRDVISSRDLFEIFKDSLRWECKFFKQYAPVSNFLFKTYFEDDPDVTPELSLQVDSITAHSSEAIYKAIDQYKFHESIDVKQLIRMCVWCTEGYKNEAFRKTPIDMDAFKAGFIAILEQFKKLSYKEEYLI